MRTTTTNEPYIQFNKIFTTIIAYFCALFLIFNQNPRIMARLLLTVFLLVLNISVFSQSIEEGKKFIYYERFKSARSVFETILQSKTNQSEASYWLSQAYLGMDDVNKARQVILSAMNSSPNDPMLIV